MSIQPLLPSGYTSLVQSLQKSTNTNTNTSSTNNASASQFDPLSILTGSADGTSGTSALDLLFGGSGTSTGDGSLASFLGNSSDTTSVFSSFTDEAKAALLQAQEEASKQTATVGTTAPSATGSSNANDPLLQALAAMMSPSSQTQSASWL
jgi:hypothetical protein